MDRRSRIGNWEGDTVIGKGHQGVLVTLIERKSRYTLACPLKSRHSPGVTQAIIDLLRPHKEKCKTLTFDNGKEFAEHEFIAKCLEAKVYFAHPYCSWERELNGNHRPRKCLGYRIPHEVFYGLKTRPLKLSTDALCI